MIGDPSVDDLRMPSGSGHEFNSSSWGCHSRERERDGLGWGGGRVPDGIVGAISKLCDDDIHGMWDRDLFALDY